MAGDLPVGEWTPELIGPWWPQPSTTLRAAEGHWGAWSKQRDNDAIDLFQKCEQLSRNQGKTADDLIRRYNEGHDELLKRAGKYKIKSDAFKSGADAIDGLRQGLEQIAEDYNSKIKAIESSNGPLYMKVNRIAALIAEANSWAASKSATAVAAVMNAVKAILGAEGVDMSPEQFLRSQGLSTDNPTAPDPKEAAEKGLAAQGDAGRGGSQAATSPAAQGDTGRDGPEASATPAASAHGEGGRIGAAAGHGVGAPGAGGGGHVPTGGVPAGAGSGVGAGAGGSLSPAAALGAGASPNSLGNSFTSGMAAGQPAAFGTQSLGAGTVQAAQAGAPPPTVSAAPPAPFVSPPTIAAGSESVGSGHIASGATPMAPSAPAVASDTAGGGVAPLAPMTATPSASAAPSPSIGSGVPAGPLPAYGSDLRPPVVAPPPASAGPVAGAPAAPASSPSSAGASLTPAVERAAPMPDPVGKAGPSSTAAASATAGSALNGAVAGDVAWRTEQQQRLQRLVNAVARQAPGFAWAAGLKDDGKTLLVSEIGGGWIPPIVQIPRGVDRLLGPAHRRDGATVGDLLGATTVSVTYRPNSYIAEPGADEPELTADRTARAVPAIDELGPRLVDVVRCSDGLPRWAETLAKAATRRTGVPEVEVGLLKQRLTDIEQVVQDAPLGGKEHVEAGVNWMLLSAIKAVIDGDKDLCRYHLTWAIAAPTKARGIR